MPPLRRSSATLPAMTSSRGWCRPTLTRLRLCWMSSWRWAGTTCPRWRRRAATARAAWRPSCSSPGRQVEGVLPFILPCVHISILPSFLPSFCPYCPSFLPTLLSIFLPYILLYFLSSILLSFPLTFLSGVHSSFRPSLYPSYFPRFIPSFLPSFLPFLYLLPIYPSFFLPSISSGLVL